MSTTEAEAGYHYTWPRGRSRALLGLGLALAILASALPPALSAEGGTERVSVDSTGTAPDGNSHDPAVSADGRYVAFASEASDLVVGDENSTTDVFVVDRVNGTTERVSVDSSGGEANGLSTAPAISADGRYVAFTSAASDLVPEDSNGGLDVFVRDRELDTTERVSVDTGGVDPNAGSSDPSISADGRYVAFASDASDLVTGDANGSTDVFVHDREDDSTERVSLGAGAGGPNGDSSGAAISADGGHVAFHSAAGDIDPDDTNPFIDVFVHDRQSNDTEWVSVDTTGPEADGDSSDPTISATGRYVAFASSAGDLIEDDTNSRADVFIRDCTAQTTERASRNTEGGGPDGRSSGAAISASGRYVAFQSDASDLVANDGNGLTDVFVHDREGGTTDRVSLDTDRADPDGADPDGASSGAGISADGRHVAFQSAASDLVADDDGTLFDDVFLHDFLGPPQLLLTPPSHAFGAQAVAAGPTDAFTFTVSNIGAGPMNIASIGVSGVDAGHFAIASKTCGATVTGGEGCDVNVVFDPASAGTLTATLEVATGGGNGSSVLSGAGTAPPASTGSGPDTGAGANPQPLPGSGPSRGARPRCSGRIATVVGAGRRATIKGTAGRDVIVGTSGDDLIRGGGGRDLICGRGGDDRLVGGGAGDDLHGAAGDDRLGGDAGADSLHGDSGADVLSGGAASDELHGGSGRDRLDGGGGTDKLRGGAGADRCRDGRGPQRAC